MPYLQPTVRQLQPLGRGHHSAPIMDEDVAARARVAETVSPDANTSAPRRRGWRRRLTARATPST
jgi:hypothetical protein